MIATVPSAPRGRSPSPRRRPGTHRSSWSPNPTCRSCRSRCSSRPWRSPATRHAELTRGAAQAGMAAAVLDLRMDDPDGLVCLIASVWVGTLADDEEAVFENTREATKAALQLGAAAGPWHGNLAAVETPENPDFRRDLTSLLEESAGRVVGEDLAAGLARRAVVDGVARVLDRPGSRRRTPGTAHPPCRARCPAGPSTSSCRAVSARTRAPRRPSPRSRRRLRVRRRSRASTSMRTARASPGGTPRWRAGARSRRSIAGRGGSRGAVATSRRTARASCSAVTR